MSLNEYVLILAVILIISDFFLASDIATHIAWLLVACLISYNIDMPFLYHILIAFAAWVGLIFFHYLIWQKLMHSFVNRFISKDKLVVGLNNLVGMSAKIKEINGIVMAQVAGDLYEILNDDFIYSDKTFYVTEVNDGKVQLKIKE